MYLLDVHDGVLPSRPDAADGTEDERRVYEEDRRLFYVAMTRAKDELTLFEYPDAPSAFICEARGYLPVPVCAKDDFAAIVPENACGLRYRHETRGEGRILAQCEDEMLLAFPDGDRLMRAGQMLLERSRAEVFQLPDAPAAAQLPDAQAFMPGNVIRHGPHRIHRRPVRRYPLRRRNSSAPLPSSAVAAQRLPVFCGLKHLPLPRGAS